MSAGLAYLPLFGTDYLADTTHLTTEEHGAYLLLMLAAWRQDDCGLPLDDKKLARITGLSARKWAAMKDTILDFWLVREGRIYQPRLLKEWDYARKKSEANRRSAAARWSKQATENTKDVSCDRISDRNAPQPQPYRVEEEPIGSPSTSAHERAADEPKPKRTRKPKPEPIAIPDWLPAEPWDAYLEMRRAKGAKPTDHAINLLIRKLADLRQQGHDPGRVLDQSTVKNWTDVYPLKDQPHGNATYQHQQPSRDTRDGALRYLDRRLGLDPAAEPARPPRRPDDGRAGGGLFDA